MVVSYNGSNTPDFDSGDLGSIPDTTADGDIAQ